MPRTRSPVALDHPIISAAIDYVCKAVEISPSVLKAAGSTRLRPISLAKHVVWYALVESKLFTPSEVARMFMVDHTAVLYGVKMIRQVVLSPNVRYGKEQYYTVSRKKWVGRLACGARDLVISLTKRQAEDLDRELIVIPRCRVEMTELENLSMADVATRFSGGWLVEVADFKRDPQRYPKSIHKTIEREEEASYVWVIPLSSLSPSEDTGDASSKGSTTGSPSTTTGTTKDPSISRETPTKPRSSKASRLLTKFE